MAILPPAGIRLAIGARNAVWSAAVSRGFFAPSTPIIRRII